MACALSEALGSPPAGEAFWRAAIEGRRVSRRPAREYDAPYTPVTADSVARRGDEVRVLRHVHEPPICIDALPQLIYEDGDMLVLSKPAGMPMSGPGKGLNSLQDAAGTRHAGASPVHRLDLGVSGLVIFAKNGRTKRALTDEFRTRHVEKRYIARVAGVVPAGTDIVVEDRLDFREGRALAAPSGKPAATRVRHLRHMHGGSGLGAQSVVECLPRTGRRHQIRCHLSGLGWPIANDFTYGGARREALELYAGSPALRRALARGSRPWCRECARAAAALAGRSPRPVSFAGPIWLHALSYRLPRLSLRFEAGLPEWAGGAGAAEPTPGTAGHPRQGSPVL